MNDERPHLNVHIGNVAQLAGAALLCYGIFRVAGLGVALLVGGVLLVALANLEWDASVLRLPLPRLDRRPQWQKGQFSERLRSRWTRRTHLPKA